jgi:glucosamine--fructose-6-phosphate aminotransferase (isomerizing)
VCGIFGYLGKRDAAPVLIAALKKLEYRGYDSFGLAIAGKDLVIFKKKGKITDIENHSSLGEGTLGIGHTRWATHGIPSDRNAHPHSDCSQRIAVVHNGIIDNYIELKESLSERGHIFNSETDTEVIAHLIEEHYSGDLLFAVQQSLCHLRGTYALLIIAQGHDEIIAARQSSPLVLGFGDGEYFAASDVTPLLEYTKRVTFLEDSDVARITGSEIEIYNGSSTIVRPQEWIEWDVESARKGGFTHFMLKEIFEQADAYYSTLLSIENESPEWMEDLRKLRRYNKLLGITVVSCGTSYHASLIFRYLAEKYLNIPVRVELASEFKYFPPPLDEFIIAVSQSGETADTLAALKIAQKYHCHIIAITNVLGSSITRLSDHTIFTRAGPEISVAATKSFIAQLAAFYQILNILSGSEFDDELFHLQRIIEEALLCDIGPAVDLCSGADDVFFVGRGPFFPVALEGALKMKEISYIHAEGYAAGELKHGPFSLLTEATPVIAICTPGETYAVMISNIKEMKARNAPVVGIGMRGDRDLQAIVDIMIPLPDTGLFGSIIASSVVLQLLAYHTAKKLGRDIDRPRNLAKSVTVE